MEMCLHFLSYLSNKIAQMIWKLESAILWIWLNFELSTVFSHQDILIFYLL